MPGPFSSPDKDRSTQLSHIYSYFELVKQLSYKYHFLNTSMTSIYKCQLLRLKTRSKILKVLSRIGNTVKNNEINLSNKVQTKDWNVASKLGSETLLENKAKNSSTRVPHFHVHTSSKNVGQN